MEGFGRAGGQEPNVPSAWVGVETNRGLLLRLWSAAVVAGGDSWSVGGDSEGRGGINEVAG